MPLVTRRGLAQLPRSPSSGPAVFLPTPLHHRHMDPVQGLLPTPALHQLSLC